MATYKPWSIFTQPILLYFQLNVFKMSVDITRSAPACPQMPPLQEQGRVRVGEDHGARGKGQA